MEQSVKNREKTVMECYKMLENAIFSNISTNTQK